ncbi:MAG: nucleotidyltransferase [Ignavibacteriales bacterium CG18_big_fil_WC_8_21_14_2_50_31_20]|nr:MAG: nucleotidyltransferase [Ignavibacteriales bacterium CG18_big_fil_WC_8_21_14_2_50_31_20]
MGRSEIISRIEDFKNNRAKEFGILKIGIFGSVARDESDVESDVDIVVKMESQDLFKLIGIKQNLEEILQLPVDIISYRETMNSFLKRRIDKDVIYV